MDELMRATAEAAARQLLEHFKAEHPAWQSDSTPIDHLVAWLGLEVGTFHPHDYPQGTYGYLEPEENLIWLRRDLSATLQRFTLAHELGHVILHRAPDQQTAALLRRADLTTFASQYAQQSMPAVSSEDPCQQPDVLEELTASPEQEYFDEVLGIGQTYNPRSQRELAANIFAAELLMPHERVRALYLAGDIPPGELASIFNVSNAAMLNRLVGLLADPAETQKVEPVEHQLAEKKQYDDFQLAAIEAQTPALIVAGPGSGKTSTLIGRAEYLLQELQVPPEHILALTFSRKTAQEMQERLQGILREDAALPTVSTFHAFCAEILRTYAKLVGLRPDFTLVDDIESYFLLRQAFGQRKKQASTMRLQHYRNLYAPATPFPQILKAISRAKDELVTPAGYEQLAQRMLAQAHDQETSVSAQKALEVASIYKLYQAGLQERQDTDFGGLIMLAVQLLQDFPEARDELQQRYQHILVDEFQDINRASGVLLRLLAGDACRIWVVGDANQAIYGFRGASPANIANFQSDYPNAIVLPLSRNYRSRPDIVRLAESFRYQQLELGEEIADSHNLNCAQGEQQPARLTLADTYVTLASAADNASELSGLIADIHHKRAHGYRYLDMAVLCRTRAQARKITRALKEASLPVIERGSMLEQEHIKDLLSIVLLLADSSGIGILRAAKYSEHSFTQSDLEALLLAAYEQKRSPCELIAHNQAPPDMTEHGRQSMARLSHIVHSLGLHSSTIWSVLAQYLFIETSIMRDLLQASQHKQHLIASSSTDKDSASDKLADYAALLQLARRYDQQQQNARAQEEQDAQAQAEAVASPPTIQQQAREFLDYVLVMLSLGQDGTHRQQGTEGNAEEPADVIRVMTVHASKGLEFPVVYLPNLRQHCFPMRKHPDPVPAPAGMLPAASEGTLAQESGEACLFYVAVTRARDQLVLSYSDRNGKQKAKPSPYLDILVAGLADERLRRLQWQSSELREGEQPISTVDDQEETELIATEDSTTFRPGAEFLHAMKPSTLRAAAIEDYQRCPRRYMYNTICHFRSEEGTYQLFWQAIQQTLKAIKQESLNASEYMENSKAHVLTVEQAKALYTQHWQYLGGHLMPFASMYEQHGHEVIELMRGNVPESDYTHSELRPDYTVEVAGKSLEVTVDRVEASPEANKPIKFIRTRLGASKDKPGADTRALLYTQAFRQYHAGQSVELHSHNLSTGETIPIKLTAKKEQSLFDELEQSILGLERNEYPAKPDPFICPSCPFFLICPA